MIELTYNSTARGCQSSSKYRKEQSHHFLFCIYFLISSAETLVSSIRGSVDRRSHPLSREEPISLSSSLSCVRNSFSNTFPNSRYFLSLSLSSSSPTTLARDLTS